MVFRLQIFDQLEVSVKGVCCPRIYLSCVWSGLGTTFIHKFKVFGGLIIFEKADENQARLLNDILKDFCNYSSHRVNARKSNIFFSKGMSEEAGRHLSAIMGFTKVHNLGSYLGIPLFHEKVTNSTLRFIIDRVHNKL